jgi:excisionase family DNA binding protein
VSPKPTTQIRLREAAERLGVHYMTAYRYVRMGTLPATKVGGEWRVRTADLERFSTHEDDPPGAGGVRWPKYREQLADRLVLGDEAGAWTVVERALASGASASDIHLELIAPVLTHVGDAWADGELDVGNEHQASSVAIRLIGRLGPSFARRGRKRGVVVIGAVSGDHHAIPTLLLRDVLRGKGFEVVDLGAHTPEESFTAAANDRDDLIAVALSVGWNGAMDAAKRTVARLHEQIPDVVVYVGGPGVRDGEAARKVGADAYGETALDVAVGCIDLADARRRARRSP